MSRTMTQTIRLAAEDVYRGDLILVNPDHPIRCPIEARRLEEVAPGIVLERKTATIFNTVLQKIGAGAQVVPISGFRTKSEQENIYADTAAQRGVEYAATYVALPDCSEHQTGLAIDVGLGGESIDFITPSFPYWGISQTFRRQAVRHGFIERYPKGKERITRIGHEPWHFRYVGWPHAALMTSLNLVLEEYTQWVTAYPFARAPYQFAAEGGVWTIGYVPAMPGGPTLVDVPGLPYTLSGNNVDGFVVAALGV